MNSKLLAILSAAACFTAGAHADTIQAQYTGKGRGSNVRIAYPGNTGQNVFSGQLHHTLFDGTGAASALNGNWVTYCTDVYQHVSSGGAEYTVLPVDFVPSSSPMGDARADAIENMYLFAAGLQLTAAATNEYATAFQLAVWEIVHDFDAGLGLASLNITGGLFRATKTDGSSLSGGVLSHLSTFFTAAAGAAPAGEGGRSIMGLASGSAQDQIIATSIPAPGPLALAALGGLCLIPRRRKA